METKTYPKASLLELSCSRCENGKPENGGYRTRSHRDLNGIREVEVLRVRCRECKGPLGCVYPEGVQRYKWYSSTVQGIFAILDVHQVDQGCANELAEHLGYAIEPETRAAWQAMRAFRAVQLEKQYAQAKKKQLAVASIDEMRLGYWWLYTLTDPVTQAHIDYAFCERRDEEVVRELIAENDPDMIIRDGCSSIAAACDYFADKPHGRCWFHIKEVLKQFSNEERKLVSYDLRYLYTCTHVKDAEWFLAVLKKCYPKDKLEALLNVWEQLKLYWHHDAMPLTNNASETLCSAIWARSRKRVVNALHRAKNWFIEARWRWHHLVRGISPWQRFSDIPSKPWLYALITPLKYSTDFSG